ncbi:NAD(P)/FAD-dependent oxidoreductase [Xanthobacter sp. AM11]|uniref:NAD(P)/FAD-dependent oxidoreductase n=1 Tax=Xanthobacter sp. AM11 TaxID=3380643 RepID=UPI0039BF4AE4
MKRDVVIIGGGQAGMQVATSLRNLGYPGSIALVGEEAHLPYMRPPLSKGFLKGLTDAADLIFRRSEFFTEAGIDILLGYRATAFDGSSKIVILSDGRTLEYETLILATGTRARQLVCNGASLRNVVYLRTIDDATAIASALPRSRKIAVIGAGFVGLEFASVVAEKGSAITVIEMASRVMGRATSPLISRFFEQLHYDRGVDLRLGEGLATINGDEHGVCGLSLRSGSQIPADLVVVGIGVLPNAELAEAAGINVDDGIVVDANLRTSDPNVYAIGDCARLKVSMTEPGIRLESVQNAVDQAKYLAGRLVGHHKAPFKAVPWFWTEQFETKLQMAGLYHGYDDAEVVGDPQCGSFSINYRKDGRLLAVDSINRPADHLKARRALALDL